uniref:ubiquitinyl hydrolase 1 n=1 Tax=Timema poppense TaxID=170557 RepID=A0A7R9D9W0_TIMPO|nr:unnamed protein product [Timema poppensis]
MERLGNTQARVQHGPTYLKQEPGPPHIINSISPSTSRPLPRVLCETPHDPLLALLYTGTTANFIKYQHLTPTNLKKLIPCPTPIHLAKVGSDLAIQGQITLPLTMQKNIKNNSSGYWTKTNKSSTLNNLYVEHALSTIKFDLKTSRTPAMEPPKEKNWREKIKWHINKGTPNLHHGTPNTSRTAIYDDSLGYEFPFILKAVSKDGSQCAWCPFYKFCRGCRIQCSDAEFNFSCSHLAVDWDPTALHLRYQTSQERVFIEHESVALTRQQQSEPINLDYCLEAFTKEEHLGEDEKYYCSKCREHQVANKKLQIWRLPPILIVHLKRFQFVNGKWVKSQKIVNFPFDDFDPTAYLASVPKHTVVRHQELKLTGDINLMDKVDHQHPVPLYGSEEAISLAIARKNVECSLVEIVPSREALNCESETKIDISLRNGILPNIRQSVLARERLESTSLVRTPVTDGALQDFHQHRIIEKNDPFSLKYRLYAIVCHSGILGGGHYVSYACNPNGKWYCYNDSSCKEINMVHIDTSSAYMLFYEREGLDHQQYMPSIAGKTADTRDLDDEFDSDLKKLCCLM